MPNFTHAYKTPNQQLYQKACKSDQFLHFSLLDYYINGLQLLLVSYYC